MSYPRVAAALMQYIDQESRAGRPWYISPDLNSSKYGRVFARTNGFGDGSDGSDLTITLDSSAMQDGIVNYTIEPSSDFGNTGSGFGTSLWNTAGIIGKTAIQVLPSVLKAAGTLNALNHAQATQGTLGPNGITLGGNLATSASAAALADQKSAQSNQLIMVGLAFLAVMMIMQQNK